MEELSPKVANWLYNVIQPQYLHKQLVYTHIYQFLQVFLNHKSKSSRFKIRTNVFTSGNTGHSELLIELFGSVKLNDLAVPINIWVPLNYPFADADNRVNEVNGVPIVFITPNKDKNHVLIPGNYVDSQGRFYHPYLSSWFSEFNDIAKYNLIELINVLKQTFSLEPPIFIGQVPVKPAKIPLTQAATGSLRRDTTGPPVPSKPEPKETIPEKYQNPLPLPPTEYSTPIQSPPQSQPLQQAHTMQPVQQAQQAQQAQQTQQTQQAQQAQSVQDLMDQNEDLKSQSIPRETLKHLSDQLNQLLDPQNPSGVNNQLASINENSIKIDTLYDQLSHHNTQAKANSEILNNHLTHLNDQVTNLTNLNQQLLTLDNINANTPDKIATSIDSSIDLDNLITADLALVHQLYDTVSEIKANKDTVHLIGGTFGSHHELINDLNVDTCIKSIRSLARETFWLELVKDEIASTMGLSK